MLALHLLQSALLHINTVLVQQVLSEAQRRAQAPPYVPTEQEIRRYYETVWAARRGPDIVLIKTLLYTGVRVSELVAIRITDVDPDACRIRIAQGKGAKDRPVPFPTAFKETLALHIDSQRTKHAAYLFESSWKKAFSTRGVRAMLTRYAKQAGLAHNMPPHRLRHFLFTWLKTQGIDDALIQPCSGRATRESLEIYSRVAHADAQQPYEDTIGRSPSDLAAANAGAARRLAAGDTDPSSTGVRSHVVAC